MKSEIASAIGLRVHPVGLIWSNEKPENAMEFKPGKWGCIMWLVAAAAKGRTAVCDRQTFGCFGGGVGVGFGEQYRNFPGGVPCFCRFLSTGNETSDEGRQTAEMIKPFVREEMLDHFLHGERYIKTPELVERFIQSLPMVDVPAEHVVFKPLEQIDPDRERPEVVIFFADPDQISALVVLANYGRGDNENVIMPYGAGCQTIGIYPYREAKAERPRAVVGLTDLSARAYIRNQLGDNLMTFAAPLAMFQEMEGNVAGSFLERPTWLGLRQGRGE